MTREEAIETKESISLVEPIELLSDGTLVVTTPLSHDVKRVLVNNGNYGSLFLFYTERKL